MIIIIILLALQVGIIIGVFWLAEIEQKHYKNHLNDIRLARDSAITAIQNMKIECKECQPWNRYDGEMGNIRTGMNELQAQINFVKNIVITGKKKKTGRKGK